MGLGRRLPLRLLTESRIPASIARQNIVLDRLPEPAEPSYIVDPRGRPAWEKPKAPSLLLVDYSGAMRRLYNAEPVAGASLPSLTYEAGTVVYEFFARRRVTPPPSGSNAYSKDIRAGLYLARKLLEALSVFDNYYVLEPSTVAYTLRRIYINRGLLLDPASYSIDVDPVTGEVREVVKLQVFTKRLSPVTHVVAKFDGKVVEVVEGEETVFRIEFDPPRMTACAAPGLCVTTAKSDEQVLPGDILA